MADKYSDRRSGEEGGAALRRRRILELLGTGTLGVSALGSATAAEESSSADSDRDVTEYGGDGSISSPSELGEAITTGSMWQAVTDVQFSGDYGHAEVFSSDEPLLGYPSDGDTFGVISTGVAEKAPGSPDTFVSTSFGTSGSGDLPNPESGSVADASYLTLTFEVPSDAEQFSFSYRFATEEIPLFVDSEFQDFFSVGVEYPDGTTENVATLPDGEPVTVDNAAAYASESSGVVYNAATPPVTNSVDVSEYQGEELTIHLGVADVGDTAYDSAVFLDAVGFGGAVGQPEISNIQLPPTAVETHEQATFEVVVDSNAADPEDIAVEAPVTVRRRGSYVDETEASLTHTAASDGAVTVEGSLPAAVDQNVSPEGVEFDLQIEVYDGDEQIGDPIPASTFAFREVDTVFGVAAKPNDVSPTSAVANENLLTLLREQSEYVNRHYASGLGSMGGKGFDFRWLNREGSSALADDGYLELSQGYGSYDDGRRIADNSVTFVQEALDRAASDGGVDYSDYDTAIVTNGPYQNRSTHILSRSFWRGTPLPRITVPVINETIDLGDPAAMDPFDTAGGTIDGIYAPLNVDTWLHEFGHALGPGLQVGLPDLYDIDVPFQNFGNVRDWGLMGGRDGKVITSFCRSLGSDPFDSDGWVDDDVEAHVLDDLEMDLPDLTTLELGDDVSYVLSVWGYFSVDLGLKVPDVDVDWQMGIFLLEGRPGGEADFSAPYGYTPPLSPDPFDDDGVALFELGLFDVDADVDGVKEIIDDIANDRAPDLLTVNDAEAVDVDYVPPSANNEDRPTLRSEGDTHHHGGAATTFEMTDDLSDGTASVTLSRDTGVLGDAVSLIVDTLGSLEEYIESQLSGTEDPIPPLDVIAETPDGRRVGFDPETGEVVNDIDGASIGGTASRRRVTVPSSVDVEFTVSASRLKSELSERGIEPPTEIDYERTLLTDENLTVEDRDGLPFLAGRTAIKDEATTSDTDRAVRTADVEIRPQRLNAASKGQFVTVHLGFAESIDPSAVRPATIAMSGVQAVSDDSYEFVENPPIEARDGREYLTVKFPRDEVIDALGTGSATPQVTGALGDELFRGTGAVEVVDPSGSNGANSSPESGNSPSDSGGSGASDDSGSGGHKDKDSGSGTDSNQ